MNQIIYLSIQLWVVVRSGVHFADQRVDELQLGRRPLRRQRRVPARLAVLQRVVQNLQRHSHLRRRERLLPAVHHVQHGITADAFQQRESRNPF